MEVSTASYTWRMEERSFSMVVRLGPITGPVAGVTRVVVADWPSLVRNGLEATGSGEVGVVEDVEELGAETKRTPFSAVN